MLWMMSTKFYSIGLKEKWWSNCHGWQKKVVIFLICKVLLRFYTYFHFKAQDVFAIDDYYYHKPCGYSTNSYTTKKLLLFLWAFSIVVSFIPMFCMYARFANECTIQWVVWDWFWDSSQHTFSTYILDDKR